jgi:hypothetical protein
MRRGSRWGSNRLGGVDLFVARSDDDAAQTPVLTSSRDSYRLSAD